MQRCTLAGLPLLALLAFAGAAGFAAATPTDMGCALVSRAGASGTRFWQLETSTPDQLCTSASDPRLDLAPGASVTLRCSEWTTGVAPSDPASAIFVYIYHDADSYQGAGAQMGQVREIVVGSTCTANPTWVLACTHDGTTTGTPRHGILRLVLRARKDGIGPFDLDSDATGQTGGIIRCTAGLATHAVSRSNGQPITTTVPGDTIRTTAATSTAPYATSGTTAKVSLLCGAQDNTVTASVLLTATASTHDKQISLPTSAWPDDCSLQSKVTLTRKSALVGLASLDYATFTGTPPAGTTYGGAGLTATRTAGPYDATHTLSLPTWASPRCSGATSETFRIAVDLMALQPSEVRNARGDLVTLAKAFVMNVTEYDTGISIGQKEFTGVTDPTAPCATLAPAAPPSDHWRYNVTVTDAHGGQAKAFKNVSFIAPGGGTTNVNTSVNVNFNDDFDVGLLDDRLEGPAPYVGRIVTRGGSLVAQVSIDVDADGTYDAQYTGRSALHTHTWSAPGIYPWVVKVLYTDGTPGYAYGETHVRSAYAKDPLSQPGGGLFAPGDAKGGIHFTPSLMWDWLVGLALLAVACLIVYFRIIAGNG